MSPITSHVLDTSRGKPAAGIAIVLETFTNSEWRVIGRATTNLDGRVTDLLSEGKCTTGIYRLTFETAAYFRTQGEKCFYPSVAIQFEIENSTEHYHVPLLLSPYGYSTYRGS